MEYVEKRLIDKGLVDQVVVIPKDYAHLTHEEYFRFRPEAYIRPGIFARECDNAYKAAQRKIRDQFPDIGYLDLITDVEKTPEGHVEITTRYFHPDTPVREMSLEHLEFELYRLDDYVEAAFLAELIRLKKLEKARS